MLLLSDQRESQIEVRTRGDEKAPKPQDHHHRRHAHSPSKNKEACSTRAKSPEEEVQHYTVKLNQPWQPQLAILGIQSALTKATSSLPLWSDELGINTGLASVSTLASIIPRLTAPLVQRCLWISQNIQYIYANLIKHDFAPLVRTWSYVLENFSNTLAIWLVVGDNTVSLIQSNRTSSKQWSYYIEFCWDQDCENRFLGPNLGVFHKRSFVSFTCRHHQHLLGFLSLNSRTSHNVSFWLQVRFQHPPWLNWSLF